MAVLQNGHFMLFSAFFFRPYPLLPIASHFDRIFDGYFPSRACVRLHFLRTVCWYTAKSIFRSVHANEPFFFFAICLRWKMLAPWKCSKWHSNENLFRISIFQWSAPQIRTLLSLLVSWFPCIVWHFWLYIVYTWLHIHFAALRFHLPNNKCCHSMFKNADGDEHHPYTSASLSAFAAFYGANAADTSRVNSRTLYFDLNKSHSNGKCKQ